MLSVIAERLGDPDVGVFPHRGASGSVSGARGTLPPVTQFVRKARWLHRSPSARLGGIDYKDGSATNAHTVMKQHNEKAEQGR
jgi:hypothetical protein